MGTYNVPRDVSGEDRILFIFSRKALLYTAACALVGLIFYAIFKAIGLNMVGIIIMSAFALIGFIVGTIKIPNIQSIKWARANAGEKLDDVIKRFIIFKKSNNKIYIYNKNDKEEITNDKQS